MVERYFEKFPTISYSNNEVIDITRRTALFKSVSENPFAYYPYDISSGEERADYLSFRYYDDSYMSWIIYHANEIIDPYYQWHMNYDDFNRFIDKRYGSLQDSILKVHHYRNNWENAGTISVEDYNALTDGQKNYWDPIYNYKSIDSYKRKEVDWRANTNKIIKYTVENANTFIKDEVCSIDFDGLNIGKGQIAEVANNTTVYMQHVSGYFYTSDSISIMANSHIYGSESKSNTIFTSVTAVANNIPEEELVYWREVTNYDYENEKNEFNSTIRLMDSKFKDQITEELTLLMGE